MGSPNIHISQEKDWEILSKEAASFHLEETLNRNLWNYQLWLDIWKQTFKCFICGILWCWTQSSKCWFYKVSSVFLILNAAKQTHSEGWYQTFSNGYNTDAFCCNLVHPDTDTNHLLQNLYEFDIFNDQKHRRGIYSLDSRPSDLQMS